MAEDGNNQEALLKALQTGDILGFEHLLNCPDVSANFKYAGPSDWGTCLENACRLKERANFVELLLNKYKIKPNVHDIFPEPIHFASRSGNVETLKVLLRDKRIRVNVEDSDGRTALHHVAKNFSTNPNAYEECFELLLRRPDVDVNRANRKNCTAIREAAVFSGRESVVVMLRLRPLDYDLDSHFSIGKTARQVILDKFPDLEPLLPPARVKSELHNCVIRELQCGNYENVRKLIETIEIEQASEVSFKR